MKLPLSYISEEIGRRSDLVLPEAAGRLRSFLLRVRQRVAERLGTSTMARKDIPIDATEVRKAISEVYRERGPWNMTTREIHEIHGIPLPPLEQRVWSGLSRPTDDEIDEIARRTFPDAESFEDVCQGISPKNFCDCVRMLVGKEGKRCGLERVTMFVEDVREFFAEREGRGLSHDIKGKYGLVARQRTKKH